MFDDRAVNDFGPYAGARRRQLVAVAALVASVSGAVSSSAAFAPLFGSPNGALSIDAFLMLLVLAAALLSPVIGWWCDRKTSRQAVLWGAVLVGAGWGLTALQGSRWTMLAMFIAGAVGGSQLVTLAAISHLIRWRPRRLGLALGVVIACLNAAALAIYVVSSVLAVRARYGGIGGSGVMALVGLSTAAIVLTLRQLLTPTPAPAADVFGDAHPGDDIAGALEARGPMPLRNILLLLLATALGIATFRYGLLTYTSEAAVAAGVTLSGAALRLIYVGHVAATAAGLVAFGWWVDRSGPLVVLARGAALTAASLASTLFAPAGFAGFVVLTTAAAAGSGCIIAPLVYVADHVSPRRIGFAIGVASSLEGLGSILSRAVANVFADGRLPEAAAMGLGAAVLAIVAAVAFTAAAQPGEPAPALTADAMD